MKQIRPVIDVMMSITLLFLMAFQVTGDKYHEWIGAGMLVGTKHSLKGNIRC